MVWQASNPMAITYRWYRWGASNGQLMRRLVSDIAAGTVAIGLKDYYHKNQADLHDGDHIEKKLP